MVSPMIAFDVDSTTREVWGNIAVWMRVVFFAMIAASLAVLGWQLLNHVRQWRQGRPADLKKSWRSWLQRLTVYALAQKARAQEVARRRSSSSTLQWLRCFELSAPRCWR
jgi:hypothetical protein